MGVSAGFAGASGSPRRPRLSATRHGRLIALLVLGLAAAAAVPAGQAAAESAAAPRQAGKGPLSPIVATPTPQKAITPVRGSDGRLYVVYELQLTNTLATNANLRAVHVTDAASGRELLSLDAGTIVNGHYLHRLDRGEATDTKFPSFNARLLVLPLSFKSRREIPAEVTQRFTVRGINPFTHRPKRFDYGSVKVSVSNRRPPVVRPPLDGTGWLASDACCGPASHVTATVGLNGKLQAAERFAVDWIKVDRTGRVYFGEKTDVRSWVGYGARIYSVADGVVTSAHDGEPDQVPGDMPPDLPLMKAPGNYVAVAMEGGYTAVYAHMKPGSVRVSVGDRVRAGQLLGLLGNTGASSAPHLHFHIVNGPNVVTSDGYPYEIDRFDLAAQATTKMVQEALNGLPGLPKRSDMRPVRHRGELPLNFNIVDFPGGE